MRTFVSTPAAASHSLSTFQRDPPPPPEADENQHACIRCSLLTKFTIIPKSHTLKPLVSSQNRDVHRTYTYQNHGLSPTYVTETHRRGGYPILPKDDDRQRLRIPKTFSPPEHLHPCPWPLPSSVSSLPSLPVTYCCTNVSSLNE